MLRMNRPKRKRRPRLRRRRSPWRRLGALLTVVLGSVLFLSYSSGYFSGSSESTGGGLRGNEDRAVAEARGEREAPKGPTKEEVIGRPEGSPEAAAYRAVALELPGVEPGSIEGVYRSSRDPSWASVRLQPSGEDMPYIVFAHEEGGEWRAEKAIRADEPEYPDNETVALDGVPEDLVASIYPENMAEDPEGLLVEPERPGRLPELGPVEFSPTRPVVDGEPGAERGRVDDALGGISGAVEGYEEQHGGIAGAYVIDVNGGWGYGVRPDEPFFGASVMKVPLMVAVYRKMDEGELSLNDSFPTEEGDWAAGAGWLQWDEPGIEHTVQDYLYMMMTQSDNVATNALMRKVGGPEYVNEVARDLGARNTVIYQKVTSERGATPYLDNRTTPRDMAKMLSAIATGQAASRISCEDMMYVMYQNNLDRWLEAGLPADTEAANKTGWLYKVYNDAGIVTAGERPYVVAIFSKHGPEDVEVGKLLIKDVSAAAWNAQSRE
jgi:beta-lactamase class A